jgi:hypothetical protein
VKVSPVEIGAITRAAGPRNKQSDIRTAQG